MSIQFQVSHLGQSEGWRFGTRTEDQVNTEAAEGSRIRGNVTMVSADLEEFVCTPQIFLAPAATVCGPVPNRPQASTGLGTSGSKWQRDELIAMQYLLSLSSHRLVECLGWPGLIRINSNDAGHQTEDSRGRKLLWGKISWIKVNIAAKVGFALLSFSRLFIFYLVMFLSCDVLLWVTNIMKLIWEFAWSYPSHVFYLLHMA